MTIETELAEAQKAFAAALPPSDMNFQLGFYSSKKKTYIDLAIEGKASSVQLDDKTVEYCFNDPIFIHRITLLGQGIIKASNIKLEVKSIQGKWSQLEENDPEDGEVEYDFGSLVTALRLSCPKATGLAFWVRENLTGIKVECWSLEDIQALEDAVSTYHSIKHTVSTTLNNFKQNIDNEKAVLEAKKVEANLKVIEASANFKQKEAELKVIEDKIENSANHLETLSDNVASIKEILDDEKLNLENVKNQQSSVQTEVVTLSNISQEKTEQLRLINVDIANKKVELAKLQSDKSLYADDIKGLAQQGADQIKTYLYFIIVPALILIGTLSWWSIDTTKQLLKEFTKHPERLEGLLVIRCFTLLFVVSVLIAIYKIMNPFIRSLIQIHQRRIRIAEISLLAKNFTENFEVDEETEEYTVEEQRSAASISIRTNVIREYLAGKYDPELSKERRLGAADLLAGLLSTKVLGFQAATNAAASLINKKNTQQPTQPPIQ